MEKKIVIIGGGISGLTAGIYAQKAGFESVIYEKHTIAGGQCTGWNRKGCFIDGCLDWLTGSASGSDLNGVWRETGALGDDVKILQMDNFGVYGYDGVKITLWQDLDRTEKELSELSPEDEDLIRRFIADCKTAQSMAMPAKMPMDMLPFKELMAMGKDMAGMGRLMSTLSKLTCKEYAAQYKHPAIRKVFETCMPDGYSFYSFIFSYAIFCSGSGGLPEGGSVKFVERMVKRYKDLGGKLITGASAKEFIIDKKQVKGILMDDDSTVKGDYYISSCDVKHTFDVLLKGKYHDAEFEKRFNDPETYSAPTSAMVSFCIDADMSAYPHKIFFETEPLTVGVTTFDSLGVKHFCYEPSFAPEGKSVATVILSQSDNDYEVWEKLRENPAVYKAEKERISAEVAKRIEAHFPELAGKLECIDVATPITYNRYTNAYHGAWMSFMMTPKSKMMMHKGLVKEIDNLLLSGMWLQPPGGTPVAAVTGKFAVQRICKKEKMPIVM